MSAAMPPSSAATGSSARRDRLAAAGMPPYVLIPGDPDRVDVIAAQWDNAELIALPRGYRAAVGTFRGHRLGAISSGIGAPSLESILADLGRLGVHTMIRVGTTGSLRTEIGNGTLIINDACVRMDGTTHLYVRPEYPAAASWEVTGALVDAARTLGAEAHVGTGCTTGSFVAGQGRAAFDGYESPVGQRLYDEMIRARVLNFEMEAAALLTLARLAGQRAGSVCSVIANRITGEWADNGGIERACRVASAALVSLAERDGRRSA